MGVWDDIGQFGKDAWGGVKNYGRQLDPWSQDFNPWATAATVGSFGMAAIPLASGNALVNAIDAPDARAEEAAAAESASAEQGATEAIDKTIAANRSDVRGPFGTTDWNKNKDGTWTMNQGFSGPMQGAADAMGQQLQGAWSQPMMTGDAARDQAINAAYGQATSRLDPRFQRDESALRTRLQNQGLDPQSAAYAHALQEFGQHKNDAYSSAMSGAIGQGTAAGNSVFQNNLQARMAPLQGMASMQGLLPGQGGASGANYLNAHQAGLDAKAAAAQQGGLDWQALAQLGITGASLFSDERLKTNITRFPAEVVPGVPLATWEYIHKPGRLFVGVIAQDLLKSGYGEHVETDAASGFLKVRYSEFAPHLGREVSHG